MLAVICSCQARAFVVEDIEVRGLKRIAAGTAYNYLPIRIGADLQPGDASDAIRSLYKTGFFQDIQIKHNGSTLIVELVENPLIDRIEFKGNKELSTEQLTAALSQIGFDKGQAFNRALFERVNRELRAAYFVAGKYGAEINSSYTPLERNRIAVIFSIAEGEVAKIDSINIVGNERYADKALLEEFELRISGWLSWFKKDDRYSNPKLTADIEKLRSFYLDKGFIKFNVESVQVSITPDKQKVYITINVSEGKRYRVRDIKLQGDLVIDDKAELFERISVVHGGYFSRLDVTETIVGLKQRLSDASYAFASVRAEPIFIEDSDEVDVVFHITPGKRVYVRRINFSGNTSTRDEVLRREMRQLESNWYSAKAIRRSEQRLRRLGFFRTVKITTPTVPGVDNQLDVNVDVVESSSGNLTLGASYSGEDGVAFNTNISQDNFFGSGNKVVLTYARTASKQDIDFNFVDPYWTHSGISRDFRFLWHTTQAGAAAASDDYDRIERGIEISLGIPVTEYNRINAGVELVNTNILTGTDVSSEVSSLLSQTGNSFTALTFNSSWAFDNRDSRLLPTQGVRASLYGRMTLSGIGLSYYKAGARYRQYRPLPGNLIFTSNHEIDYGDGFGSTADLPVFSNFFLGGIRTVRGFKPNSIGPLNSAGNPLGGNLKLVNSAQVILPLSKKKGLERVRLTAFIDSGTVYGSHEDFDLGKIRVSAGVAATWLAPIGPLSISYGIPLVKKSGDSIQRFQLLIGLSY